MLLPLWDLTIHPNSLVIRKESYDILIRHRVLETDSMRRWVDCSCRTPSRICERRGIGTSLDVIRFYIMSETYLNFDGIDLWIALHCKWEFVLSSGPSISQLRFNSLPRPQSSHLAAPRADLTDRRLSLLVSYISSSFQVAIYEVSACVERQTALPAE